jgi:DNA-binding NtrC family response regulator
MVMKNTARVLVVDDDEIVGRSFDRVLTEKGYAVSTALNGEEALNKVDENKFDVVFADIKMPGMDGLEMTKRIREKCPWTPVVIITGYGTAANEARAEVLGVSGFVRKPLTPDMIEGITQKALLDKEPIEAPQTEAEPAVEPEAEVAETKTVGAFVKNVVLLFLAPLVGLAYALVFPLVGFGMLAWLGARALAHRGATE